MNKLLNAYYSRLFKWTVFRIMLAVMFAGGIAAAALTHSMQNAWNLPYIVAYVFFPHYIGILTGLLNYPFFTNGTIRNQLSVGHKRSNIYFAGWVVSNTFAVLLYLVFAVSFLAVISLLSDPASAASGAALELNGIPESAMAAAAGTVSFKAISASVILSAVQIIFFTTITQLFCIILKGVKSFLAIYLGNQAIMLAGFCYVMLAVKLALPEKLFMFFPTCVCMSMGSSFTTDPDFIPALLIMAAETIIVFAAGILFVRRTDFN